MGYPGMSVEDIMGLVRDLQIAAETRGRLDYIGKDTAEVDQEIDKLFAKIEDGAYDLLIFEY